jgi:hypothetical protein
MNDLKLFNVNVSQEWSASEDALVLAYSEKEAKDAATKIVKLYPEDDYLSTKEAHANEVSLLKLETYVDNSEIYFIARDKSGNFDYYEYEEFQSFISEEKIEELKRQKREMNNGQLLLDYENVIDVPLRLDEGHVQRGGFSNGPRTPKPKIIPKSQRP